MLIFKIQTFQIVVININIFQFWFIWKGYRFNFIKAEVDIDEAGIVSKVKTSETIVFQI